MLFPFLCFIPFSYLFDFDSYFDIASCMHYSLCRDWISNRRMHVRMCGWVKREFFFHTCTSNYKANQPSNPHLCTGHTQAAFTQTESTEETENPSMAYSLLQRAQFIIANMSFTHPAQYTYTPTPTYSSKCFVRLHAEKSMNGNFFCAYHSHCSIQHFHLCVFFSSLFSHSVFVCMSVSTMSRDFLFFRNIYVFNDCLNFTVVSFIDFHLSIV